MTAPIRVLLVDDQPLIRSAMRDLVAHEPDLTVVAEAADGIAAVERAVALAPDMVVMDIRMPGLDGIAATERIRSNPALAGVRVLILTTFEIDDHVLDALRAGASGFIGKGARPEAIVQAIRVVHAGESLLSQRAMRALMERSVLQAPPRPEAEGAALETLTDRERDVLAMVGDGLSNAEIAGDLHLSPLTVKTHVNRAMAKLHAHDRAQLVIVAYEHGLVRGSQRT